MRIFILSIVSVFLLSTVVAAQNTPPRLHDDDQVRLVAFRALLKPWLPKPQPERSASLAKSFYFSIEKGEDPSDELMKALGEARVPLSKASKSFISDAGGSGVMDKKTKKPGILFLIYKIIWKSKDEVVVSAGNEEGNMSAYSCDYLIRRDDDGWRIVSAENCMIS
ncbi:MAG: hypothetical protein ABI646_07565 [Acidobacteriota bacterium]